ncbi:hypothetical protein TH606_10605 [Thermodesulfatator autotrophicus]|uniref:Fibronectin type-III domain-containing protein n=2 Tax=Thermodesulfatator autotrophicus TaxID=1795632 RepID=A0A177E5I9_9BACT|nr:hypothetical protein TH606_10605 [Thermodesulfatator autotrophicus]
MTSKITYILLLILIVLCWKGVAVSSDKKLAVVPSSSALVLRWPLLDDVPLSEMEVEIFRRSQNTGWEKIATIKPSLEKLHSLLSSDPGLYKFLEKGGIPEKANADDYNFVLALFYIRTLADTELARAAAIFYEDSQVERSKYYQYKIVYLKEKKPVKKLVSNEVSLKYYRKPPELPVKASQEGNTVIINWPNAKIYKLYFIYRNNQNLTPYGYYVSPKNEGCLFKDQETLEEGKVYTYQVKGLTLTGERVSFKPVSIKIVDQEPPLAPDGLSFQKISPGKIKLSWKPVKAKDLSGYRVWRASSLEGPFQPLATLRSQQTSYLDKNLAPGVYYYAVSSMDYNDNESPRSYPLMVPVPDEIPPAKVKGLKASVEPGLVHLRWRSSPEKDLAGYRVYRRFGPQGPFVLLTVTPLTTETFDDNLPKAMDSTEIYYQVRALDKANNHSPPAAIKVKLPDVTPPPKPIILGHRITEKGDLELEVRFNPVDTTALMLKICPEKDSCQKYSFKTKKELKVLKVSDPPHGKLVLGIRARDKAGNVSEVFNYRMYIAPTQIQAEPKVELRPRGKKCQVKYDLPDGYFLLVYQKGERILPPVFGKGKIRLACDSPEEVEVRIFDKKAQLLKKLDFN